MIGCLGLRLWFKFPMKHHMEQVIMVDPRWRNAGFGINTMSAPRSENNVRSNPTESLFYGDDLHPAQVIKSGPFQRWYPQIVACC